MTLNRASYNPLYDLIALTFLLMLFFGASLGLRVYSAPSESRYIEIGREMAESGDFVTPRLNYVKYFEKPPLFYWIQAGATKLLGMDSFAARIPTALFAIVLCLITYGLSRMLYGRLAGWLGSLTLATSLYLFALSRVVLVDLPVSVFIAATLTCFLYVAFASKSRKRTIILYCMYTAAACAMLSKGLIGIVIPGAIVFLWLALTHRWKVLAEIRLASGTLLFLIIALPWHILVALRNPEFLHFYFIHEHFERYLTKVHGRYQPFWFFGAVLIAGLFPWIVFVCQAICTGLAGFWRTRQYDGKSLFLVLWIVFILLFFSFSDSKLIPYILPIFPAITALLGRYLASAWEEKTAPGFTFGLFLMIGLLTLMALAPSMLPNFFDSNSKVIVAFNQAKDEAQWLSIASIMAAGLLLVVYIQGRQRHVIMAFLIIAAVIVQMGDLIAAHYDKDSMSKLAGIVKALHQKDEEVVSYATYYQDLPVYLHKRITIVNWKGELEFGSANENTSAWMIDDKEFWRRWLKGDHTMFAVMRDETYLQLIKNKKPEELHLYGIQQDGRNILLANQPVDSLNPDTKKKEELKK